MAIIVNLDVMLARRKMRSKDLAETIGITEANLSLLKSGKVKGVRFSTLEKICAALDCNSPKSASRKAASICTCFGGSASPAGAGCLPDAILISRKLKRPKVFETTNGTSRSAFRTPSAAARLSSELTRRVGSLLSSASSCG